MARISVLTPTIRPDSLPLTEQTLRNQTYKDFEWLIEVGDPLEGFTLPRDYNKLLKRATGDIIVSLQDYIKIDDDFLERVASLDHSKTAYTYPVGKIRGSNVMWDWRKYGSEPRGTDSINADHWEIDLASAPRSLFLDVGGFDEAYCDGWSWENVEIALRAEFAGYKYKVDNKVTGTAIDHDEFIEHPFRNKRKNNDWRIRNTQTEAINERWKLSYL